MRLLSKVVIKSDQLVISAPVELKLVEPVSQDDQSNSTGEEQEQLLAETEELVKELLTQAELKAKEVIETAQQEAEILIAAAQKEAEQIKTEAYQSGYEQGFAAAQQEVEKNKEELLWEANLILEEAKEKKRDYLQAVKPEIVELAINIAEKLLRQQFTLQPETIGKIVNRVLEKANPDKASQVIIQVAPENSQSLQETIENSPTLSSFEKLKIETNSSLAVGSCIIITENGTYQLNTEEAMAKIKELILGAEIYE